MLNKVMILSNNSSVIFDLSQPLTSEELNNYLGVRDLNLFAGKDEKKVEQRFGFMPVSDNGHIQTITCDENHDYFYLYSQLSKIGSTEGPEIDEKCLMKNLGKEVIETLSPPWTMLGDLIYRESIIDEKQTELTYLINEDESKQSANVISTEAAKKGVFVFPNPVIDSVRGGTVFDVIAISSNGSFGEDGFIDSLFNEEIIFSSDDDPDESDEEDEEDDIELDEDESDDD